MQGDEGIRVHETVEGVSIEKRYDDEEFPFPSIVYELVSDRSDPVTVRIEDPVPAAVDLENIGFHRAFGGEDWSIEGERLCYESEIEPESTTTVVYALSGPEATDPDALFTRPADLDVEPPLGEATPDQSAGTSTPDGEPTGDVTTRDEGSSGSMLAQLARELEAGEYDESALETVVASLVDAENAPPGHLESRIAQLEEDVTRLRAYTGALETLLDETEAATLVALPERLDDVESDVAAVQAETEEGHAELQAELDSLAEAIDDDLDAMRDDLNAELDSLADTLDDDLEAMREDIDALSARIDNSDLEEAHADLEARVDEVETFLEDMRSALG